MKRFFGLYIIFFLLVLAVPVRAQDEPLVPEPVGLRPDAPTYALHGPYWVGTQEFLIEDSTNPERPLLLTVWYPASNPDGLPEESFLPLDYFPIIPEGNSIRVAAITNALPDQQAAPYPLAIYSHGNFGSRLYSVYLQAHLASYGFVVLSADHPNDTMTEWGAPIENPLESFFIRSQDIMRIIAYADELTAEGGGLAGLIDTEHIAVMGVSFGGYTAWRAGGARLDYTYFKEWCESIAVQDPAADPFDDCGMFLSNESELAASAGLPEMPEDGLFPAEFDPRVDAVVDMNGVSGYLFGERGLQEVQVPVLIIGSSADTTVNYQNNELLAFQNFTGTKALVTFENAEHSVVQDGCAVRPIWIELGVTMFCTDPVWDMDRAHDLVNHFTTAFLLDELKGDEVAAAALAPDAVSFPGIRYEAQGF